MVYSLKPLDEPFWSIYGDVWNTMDLLPQKNTWSERNITEL